MVSKDSNDVFRKLELLVDKMKQEDVFHKKVIQKQAFVIKKAVQKKNVLKRKVSKKPKSKASPKKIHEVLGLKKIRPYPEIKLKSKPFVALIEKHEKQKAKARIENAVISTEAGKIKGSKNFGKLGLKRILTKAKGMHAESIELLCTKNVVSIDENEKIAKAIDLMLKHNIRGLAVTAGHGLKGSIESDDIVKTLEQVGNKHTEALMSTPVKEVLRPAQTIEKHETFGNVIQKMDETKANRLFVVENEQPVGVVSKSDVLTKVMESSSHLGAKIETGIDKLFELVEKNGKISTDEASKILGVDAKLVEEWASILDDHSLIRIEYPIIGSIELVKK